MRLYVATKISNKEAGVMLAYKLTKLGATVTSRWLECEAETRPEEREGKRWEAFAREWGNCDLQDVASSDTVVILSVPEGMRGTWVEFGIALALNKQIHWIGGRDQTVFTWLDTTLDGTAIHYHRDAEDFLSAIAPKLEEEEGWRHTENYNFVVDNLRAEFPVLAKAIDDKNAEYRDEPKRRRK